MDTLSYKTVSANKQTVQREWFVVDADGQVLGRLASKIATYLRGKHKPTYTPHADAGDYVIVLNADKVRLTGNKWAAKKHITYSGYPGGQKSTSMEEMRDKHPERIIENAVKGMLPKNKLGRAMYKKLFVYTGNEHPHAAQQPKTLNLDK